MGQEVMTRRLSSEAHQVLVYKQRSVGVIGRTLKLVTVDKVLAQAVVRVSLMIRISTALEGCPFLVKLCRSTAVVRGLSGSRVSRRRLQP